MGRASAVLISLALAAGSISCVASQAPQAPQAPQAADDDVAAAALTADDECRARPGESATKIYSLHRFRRQAKSTKPENFAFVR